MDYPTSPNKKNHTLSPEKDMAWIGFRMVATPYAGITRVRFKGYNLSRISIPTQSAIFDLKPE
jgi:hypothetical protein